MVLQEQKARYIYIRKGFGLITNLTEVPIELRDLTLTEVNPLYHDGEAYQHGAPYLEIEAFYISENGINLGDEDYQIMELITCKTPLEIKITKNELESFYPIKSISKATIVSVDIKTHKLTIIAHEANEND